MDSDSRPNAIASVKNTPESGNSRKPSGQGIEPRLDIIQDYSTVSTVHARMDERELKPMIRCSVIQLRHMERLSHAKPIICLAVATAAVAFVTPMQAQIDCDSYEHKRLPITWQQRWVVTPAPTVFAGWCGPERAGRKRPDPAALGDD